MITAPQLGPLPWRKASYSEGGSGSCVELAAPPQFQGITAVRDSKNPDGPALLFRRSAWRKLRARIETGELDL